MSPPGVFSAQLQVPICKPASYRTDSSGAQPSAKQSGQQALGGAAASFPLSYTSQSLLQGGHFSLCYNDRIMAELTPLTPHSVFTSRRMAEFCRNLAENGNVRLACRVAGVSAQTAYRARRATPAFAACWDAALVQSRMAVEQVLADRAINGVEEAVYYHGEEVAMRRRYDSRLLLAHLARLDAKAEAEGAAQLAGHFDAALQRLEQGEQVVEPVPAGEAPMRDAPKDGDADGDVDADEEALPPVEAALRWLEQQRGGPLDAFDDEEDWPDQDADEGPEDGPKDGPKDGRKDGRQWGEGNSGP